MKEKTNHSVGKTCICQHTMAWDILNNYKCKHLVLCLNSIVHHSRRDHKVEKLDIIRISLLKIYIFYYCFSIIVEDHISDTTYPSTIMFWSRILHILSFQVYFYNMPSIFRDTLCIGSKSTWNEIRFSYSPMKWGKM